MPINDMGRLNAGWGICGFTSSLYALYMHSPAQQMMLSRGGRTSTMMLAEIKSYLRMLQADGRQDILDDIQAFTRTFGGVFATFTISAYIVMINNVVTLVNGPSEQNERYGIALPPAAVVDYLQRICAFENARLVDVSAGGNEFILGVCGTTMPMYGGLEHYLYLNSGTIYSWGQTFLSVDLAAASVGATWTVGHKIALR